MKYEPHKYQEFAYEKMLDLNKCGLFLDMGLGKTVTTLTAIDELMFNRFDISRVLVIAPLRVAQTTWPDEIQKWDHLRHLKISKILGSAKQRRLALYTEADIYIINRENVCWLCNELSSGVGNAWLFDMVVIDELSSFKSAKSARFRALRKLIPRSNRVVGLTGTPSPNGLIDLWAQLYLLDQGDRLGKTLTSYRERFFLPDKRNAQTIFNYKLKDDSEDIIKSRISDICFSMKSEDYLDLPARTDITQEVLLNPKEMSVYKEFEANAYKLFEESKEVTAVNAAALTGKLLQYANGAMYLENKDYVITHDNKLNALEEIVELSQGQPILCFYSFISDLERIKKRIPFARKLDTPEDQSDWNEGKIPLLLAHPASAGHGLNIQTGGSIIVWFGLTWSLELYQQANARLHRQGQTNKVFIHHLIAKNTVDEDVLMALQNKADIQEAVLAAVKARVA